jgi:hypothetical protein
MRDPDADRERTEGDVADRQSAAWEGWRRFDSVSGQHAFAASILEFPPGYSIKYEGPECARR